MKSLARIAAAALAVGLFAAAPARADVSCTVVEIEASTKDVASVDSKLRPLERKLKKPPFTSWNSFAVLGTSQLTLAPQKVGTVDLVHGTANVLLRDVIDRPGKKPRVQLGVTLEDAGGKRVIDTKVNVDAGDYFVAGRPLSGDRGHLVALTCSKL